MLAVFAMAWAIARAAVQSITIDEAKTYMFFVSRRLYLWYAANNHILNSTLMYAIHEDVRTLAIHREAPGVARRRFVHRGCVSIVPPARSASLFVQLTVFVCLVYNPFIFDYLVAARGYGLALGFLMWAMVYSAESQKRGSFLVTACAVSSACAGMSVNANFSFAFVNLAAMLAILLGAWCRRPNQWIRLLAACVLPGAAIVAIVSGYALSHRHPGELIYGANSLGETFGSIIECFPVSVPLRLSGAAGVSAGRRHRLGLVDLLRHQNRALGWAAAAIFAVTLAIHWTAFRLFGLLLPKDRTAIYLLPALHDLRRRDGSDSRHRRGSADICAQAFIGSLAVMAIYFLSCLRLTYFKEWYWDADMQKTYAILTCLNREHT